MISLTPFAKRDALAPESDDLLLWRVTSKTLNDLDYALRRADEEAIAEARSADPTVSERHREMASYYSIRALELIERRDARSVPILQTPR